MDLFLRLKHWQLFLIMLVAPIFIQVTIMLIAITSHDPLLALHGLTIIMALYMGTLLGWFWAMGKNLAAKLPPGVTMNVNRLKGFLLVPAIYFLLVILLVEIAATGEIDPSYDMIPFYVAGLVLMILLHLFSVFCIFYAVYFITKSYKSILLGREAEVGDYIGEFFLLWFWFVGVWIIQPKINEMFGEKNESGIV